LIADEVMTGFGRTGALFASQRSGIQPDLIALSKGLTGGFLPMGGTMASERIYQGFISENASQTFFHGHSFTANPLGCAAALASLDLLQQNPERYQQFESRHTPLLEELAQQKAVKRVRCLGTVAAFELDAGSTSYLNPIGKQLQQHCIDQGVYIRPLGNVVYLLPPLSISRWATAAVLQRHRLRHQGTHGLNQPGRITRSITCTTPLSHNHIGVHNGGVLHLERILAADRNRGPLQALPVCLGRQVARGCRHLRARDI